MGKEQRQSQRHRVHFEVRYQRAQDFVIEYAENLSAGGLFIRGATDLQRRAQVNLELTLPGFKKFRVVAEVAHVVDDAESARTGAHAGAGVHITEAPPGFDDALHSYLQRLGHRRDHCVLTSDDQVLQMIDDSGYVARRLPPRGEIADFIVQCQPPVCGIVLLGTQRPLYEAPADVVVLQLEMLDDFDEILPLLDDRW